MRQLLYLSQRKLRDEFLKELPRLRDRLQASVELPLPIGPTVSASLSPSSGQKSDDLRHLKNVIRYLNRIAVGDYRQPTVRPLDWVRFDLPLVYGTTYDDGQIPRPPIDDVALFANLRTFEQLTDTQHVDLLLCGSTQHLTRRVASEGRMGSDTDWLYSLIVYLKDLEVNQQAISYRDLDKHGISPEATHPDMAMAVDFAHGVLQREHPKRQFGRLSGMAQVLANVISEFTPTRIILATPLYVQVESNQKRRWPWRRR